MTANGARMCEVAVQQEQQARQLDVNQYMSKQVICETGFRGMFSHRTNRSETNKAIGLLDLLMHGAQAAATRTLSS